MTSHARTNTSSCVRNPGPTSPRPPKPRLLLRRRAAQVIGRLFLILETVTRSVTGHKTAKSHSCHQQVKFEALIYDFLQFFHNVDWSLKKTWGGANEDCLARGANLVSIQSQEEEEFLSLYSKASSKWIGLKHNPAEGGGYDEC